MAAGSELKTPRSTEHSDDGFTLIEMLVIILVLAILAAIVVFSLRGVTQSSNTSACASDAKTVDVATSAYLTQNPFVANVTEADLTAVGTGTLRAWPQSASNAYSIVIAGDGNSLQGTNDANGAPISLNDVLVDVGGSYFDATTNPSTACLAAT